MNSVPVQVPKVYRPNPLTSELTDVIARIRSLQGIIDATKDVSAVAKKSLNAVGVRESHRSAQSATLDQFVLEVRRGELENLLATEVSEVQAEEFPIPEYTADTLGTATYLGEAEGGTVEWHKLRQNGVGGSQILDAAGLEIGGNGHLKVKSDSGVQYGFQDLLTEKTDSAEDLVSETTHAAERGHLWEPVLLDIYRRHTGSNVVIGKQTWLGNHPWQVVNVDGIILDDEGSPVGLVECKNSNSDKTWEFGVPLKFRAQLLYYLDATGLSYGDLIARVNGDVTVTRIHRGELIDPDTTYKHHIRKTISDLIPVIEESWEKVTDVQDEVLDKLDYWKSGRRREFAEHSNSVGEAHNNLWALLHYRFDLKQIRKMSDQARKEDGRTLTEFVHMMLREHYDRSLLGKLIGVDGETAAIVGDVPHRPFSPLYSDWIESGVAVLESDGRVTDYHRRHGADKRILDINGTGAVHIHGIRRDDIEGLPRFIDDPSWMYDMLSPADVIVAHNVDFEKKHLSPIMFDLVASKPWLDTKWLVKHFVNENHVTDGNRLKDFAEAHDVAYEGAHRAHVDARMMMEALGDFLTTFPDF